MYRRIKDKIFHITPKYTFKINIYWNYICTAFVYFFSLLQSIALISPSSVLKSLCKQDTYFDISHCILVCLSVSSLAYIFLSTEEYLNG